MVDPIGFKPSTTVERRGVARVSAGASSSPTQRQVQAPGSESITGAARAMAATPPVDAERVAVIRKAIAEGRFPILPATVADRILALKLNWDPNEQA